MWGKSRTIVWPCLRSLAAQYVAFTDEQKGFLFLLLKTVIDVLDLKGSKSTLQKE
jgi:hypothetical protein